MDRPGDSQQPPPKEQQEAQAVKVIPPSYRSLYLILYNCISAFLWSVVLGRVLSIATIHGYQGVHIGTGRWTRLTQTLAGLEVLHAAIGTGPLTERQTWPSETNAIQVSSEHPF